MAWEGRFTEAVDSDVAAFTSSFAFDRCLYLYDIEGSIAHTEGLVRAGLLTPAEKKRLVKGLKAIRSEMAEETETVKAGTSQDEDIHMHIERRLVEKVGELGGKLHTGRSRNDQVALDLRLYLRTEIEQIVGQIVALQKNLVVQAEEHINTVVPGYTHLQRAQPISLAHTFLAYYEMLERDRTRLLDGLKRLNQMPLGAGALAGNSFSIDRMHVARLLGFSQVTANSLDTVSDRDFVTEFLSNASILMMHLSRWAEDWILWASMEFGFIDLPDRYCTGSSMMPQKKNPDLLELIRGKTGRVYGALLTLLTVLKGLPLSYNRDLQEDKEPLFNTVVTLRSALRIMTDLTKGVRFNDTKMRAATEEGSLLATDLADYLVEKGLPFRQAHRVSGKIVLKALEEGKPFEGWALETFQSFSPLFKQDLYGRLTFSGSIDKKGGIGGTSRKSIRNEIRKIKRKFKNDKNRK
ncbi:MAG TPA: argininosuccinate lyase [Nitrospiria bacterium]|nr:argininosuccinate lyase [Candidatus Manganitrophaceae bacterium]HIL33857.1 argininosuccinate lyase [Candidatus Manganitrophaceae bacterium]